MHMLRFAIVREQVVHFVMARLMIFSDYIAVKFFLEAFYLLFIDFSTICKDDFTGTILFHREKFHANDTYFVKVKFFQI